MTRQQTGNLKRNLIPVNKLIYVLADQVRQTLFII